MRSILLCWAISLIGMLGDCRAATDSGPRTDAVHLNFGWSPGMKLSVATVTRTSLKSTGSPREGHDFDRSVAMAYDLSTLRSGENILISFIISQVNGVPVTPDQAVRLRGLLPSFTITTAGDFLSVDPDGGTGLTEQSQEFDTQEGNAVMPGYTPDRLVRVVAVATWNNLVGLWRNVDFLPGEEITRTHPANSVLLGQDVGSALTYRLSREVACARAGITRRCVEVEVSSTAGASQFEGMIARMTSIARQTDPSFSMVFDNARMTMSALIETEGMIPHHSLRTTTISMYGTEHGQPIRSELVKIDESSFDFK